MRGEARFWKDGDLVVILDHPHPGKDPWRWVYCQQLADVFVGHPKVTIYLSRNPRAAATYRFAADELIRLEE
jgi:hypothetical protein